VRTSRDALRSVARYVAVVLGDLWEVRLWAERGTLAYPFVRVQTVGPAARSGPALYYAMTQALSIECYPEPTGDTELSILAATDVCDALILAFAAQGVGEGRGLRIPLYDYDGVELTDPSTERDSHDFLRLVDFSTRTLVDVEDSTRVAAIADARVQWTRGGDGTLRRDVNGDPVSVTQVVESVELSFAQP
jgi:hypothetical protein